MGEAAGLNEMEDGIWRVCFNNFRLCIVNIRLDTPTVIAEEPDEEVAEYNQ